MVHGYSVSFLILYLFLLPRLLYLALLLFSRLTIPLFVFLFLFLFLPQPSRYVSSFLEAMYFFSCKEQHNDPGKISRWKSRPPPPKLVSKSEKGHVSTCLEQFSRATFSVQNNKDKINKSIQCMINFRLISLPWSLELGVSPIRTLTKKPFELGFFTRKSIHVLRF